MRYEKVITERDLALAGNLRDFVPAEIFDIHTHPFHPPHFASDAYSFLKDAGTLGCVAHRTALARYMPTREIHGLYFGMPHRGADRVAMNVWVSAEVKANGTKLSRALKVVSPLDDPQQIATELRNGLFCGLKVYHVYSSREDSMNASITEYAPEWMWEILHETEGVMMLHIVRELAITDPDNQRELRRLSRAYPRMKLILAHVARSFNYRHARNGLHVLSDLDNVVVDTSAVCETESYRAALKALGPRRVLWGSDFSVSEMRGRCVTTGSDFFWLHPEVIHPDHHPATSHEMTLVGLESLLCLQEACEDSGLTKGDIENIFLHNALGLLRPHLATDKLPVDEKGPVLWSHARTIISGGTGLLSKRAEMFGAGNWPSYFSRCSGSEVWDMEGRRYIDFAGGIGAVLLGYADADVTRAVERRLSLGTYCSLVNPEEVLLAEKLLQLHPWAAKVRYARGGGEAMAIAVRIARSATGRSGVAFCGYHGWHDWYLAANLGDTRALDGHLLPGLPPKGVPTELKGTAVPFRYNDPASFENALQQLGGNIAAVVMEPMRSEEPANNFVGMVAARCRESGAVFVVDEITSGLRYGYPGALSKIGVEPDIAVYAKAMSNGFPFAAIIGRESVMQQADESFISSSYWTDGVGPAAALAVLEKMERLHIHEEVWKKGQRLQGALMDLAASHPLCNLRVGGMPVSPTLTFSGERAAAAKALFTAKMQDEGFLVSSVVYLMHAHTEQHIAELLAAMGNVLGVMEEMIRAGRLDTSQENPGKDPGFARLA